MNTIKRKKIDSAKLDLYRNSIGSLCSIDLIDIKDISALSGEDMNKFIEWCSYVRSSPFYDIILKHFIIRIEHFVATKAEDFQEVQNERATIQGLTLLTELFERYSREYDERKKKQMKFDKNKAFTPVS